MAMRLKRNRRWHNRGFGPPAALACAPVFGKSMFLYTTTIAGVSLAALATVAILVTAILVVGWVVNHVVQDYYDKQIKIVQDDLDEVNGDIELARANLETLKNEDDKAAELELAAQILAANPDALISWTDGDATSGSSAENTSVFNASDEIKGLTDLLEKNAYAH